MSPNDLHSTLLANARAVAILRREAECELRRSKAIAESTEVLQKEFIATLSHEMRTPLNAIIGFSEALTNGAFGPIENKQHAEYIGYIHDSGLMLLGLIDEVLDFARLEQNAVEVEASAIHLTAWVDECLAMMQAETDRHKVAVTVTYDCSPEALLWSDRRRLTQVFLNLLGNAVKFAESGSVRVNVEAPGQTGGNGAVTRLRIRITDNGIGIRPADQARVFQRFTQLSGPYARRHGGLGLGLAICKRLIELLHGEIGFASVPNKETVFWFEVPAMSERIGAA